MIRNPKLEGLRVLVVEDEMLVSLLIEDILDDQGCIIVGPCDRIEDALVLADAESLDIALLDVNVAGVKIYPVVDVLMSRSIPFLFLSGYGRCAIPEDRPDWRVLDKPFTPEALVTTLADRIAAGASGFSA